MSLNWKTTTEKQAESLERAKEAVRKERDEKLAKCTWMRDRHRDEVELEATLSLTEAQYTDLMAYIQDLRDVPQQANFPEVTWPEKPSFLGDSEE